VILVPVLSLLMAQPSADTSVVVQGTPTTKVESAEDATTRSALSDADRKKLELRIVRKGTRYYWASRENRELQRRAVGAFHYFVDPAEGGYVRVFDRSTLPESLRPDGAQFEYMEHVPVWRGSVTYWGTLDTFDD
jgi:hypothetical protein